MSSSKKNSFGRRKPLLNPRDYGKDNEFRKPNGNGIFAVEILGTEHNAFAYRRKRIVRKNDPLPDIWAGFSSPYKSSEKKMSKKSRPASAKSTRKVKRAASSFTLLTPYDTPRQERNHEYPEEYKSRPRTAPKGRKSKFDIPKSAVIETKEEAVCRRKKEALSQKRARVQMMRTPGALARQSSRASPEYQVRSPVKLFGNYSKPKVVHHPSTANPEDRHISTDIMEDISDGVVFSQEISIVKKNCTIRELFTTAIPKQILFKDVLFQHPLMKLDLSYWPVNDNFLKSLADKDSVHKDITVLLIKFCTLVTDQGLQNLHGCRKLKSLDVSDNQNITDDGIRVFVKTHAHIESFALSGCQNITGVGIESLIMGCRHLDSIELAQCNGLSDSAMQAIAGHAKIPYAAKMKRVNLAGCTSVSDAGMMALITSLKGHVEMLNIKGAHGTTDIALSAFHGRNTFSTLRNIDVSTMRLGDSGLDWISIGCGDGLLELNIADCKYVSDTGMETLASRCTNLTSLNVAGCSLLTDETLFALSKYLNGKSSGQAGEEREEEWGEVSYTTLTKAVIADEIKLVQTLIANGTRVNIRERDLTFPLYHAARLGHQGMTLFLLQRGSEVDRSVSNTGETALHMAAKQGHLDIVMLLVGNGANINIEDSSGMTPMSVAAARGKINVVNFFQKKGAKGDPGPGLQSLNIKDCKEITDEGIAALGVCKRMHSLVLVGVDKLTKKSLIHLGESPASKSLTNLNVSGRYNVSNSGLNIFYGIASITNQGGTALSKMKNLTSLNLCGLFQIGDASLQSIGRHCCKLLDLNVSGCGNVNNNSIKTIAAHLTKLQVLNLSGCVDVGDDGLGYLGGFLRTDIEPSYRSKDAVVTLTDLNLFRCTLVTDVGLLHLRHCTKLVKLNIRCCKWITDRAFCGLAPYLPMLAQVNVANLLDITAKSIMALANHCPYLRTLNASKSTDVDPSSFMHAAKILPLAQVASVATAGYNGLRPIARGMYMKTRENYLEKQEILVKAAKTIERHWNEYCRRCANAAAFDVQRSIFRAFEHLNAIKIEKTWRMFYYGRQGVKNRKKEIEKRVWAASFIQRCWRGHLAWNTLIGKRARRKIEQYSALQIQKVQRGIFGRKRSFRWRVELTAACVVVQRAFRHHESRIMAKMLKNARIFRAQMEAEECTRIQCQWRMYAATKRVENRRIRMNAAALKIGSWFRSKMVVYWFKTYRGQLIAACKMVQRAYRCHDARFHVHLKKQAKAFRDSLEKEASTIIQKNARRFLKRDEFRYRRTRHKAAIKIQSHWRKVLYKRRIRFNFLYERYNKREEQKLVNKAKELYDTWRAEEESTPAGRRLRMILRNGAAIILQRTRRTILWNRRQKAIQEYQQFRKEVAMATEIQKIMRGFLGKRRFHEHNITLHKSIALISRWFKSLKLKWAFRAVLKKKRALLREAELLEKKRLIQKAWQNRYDRLQYQIRNSRATLIQKHWRIHVEWEIRMAEARAALAAQKAEEERIKKHREEIAQERIERKTWKGKFKRIKAFVSDPDKVRMALKKAPDEALKQVQKGLDHVQRQFDDEKHYQMKQEELKTAIHSIQARQKTMVAQAGVVDIHISVGGVARENFREAQKVHENEGRSYFEPAGADIHHSYFVMSAGQKVTRPKHMQLWSKTGYQRTAHIITDIKIVKKGKFHNDHEAQLYRLGLRNQGYTLVWDPKLPFEIHVRRDGGHLIREVKVVTEKRVQDKMKAKGWIQIEPSFAEFGCDENCYLYVKHTSPPLTDEQRKVHFQAIDPDDHMDTANMSMDAHSRQLLLEQIQYVGYSSDDVDHLRGVFHKMDADDSGTVDVDEFFAYIGEKRTPLSDHIFSFHEHPIGTQVEGEILDFGMFVKVISNYCLFDENLLCRFFWHMIDPEGTREAKASEVKQLLDMMDNQAPGVLTVNARKLAVTKLNLRPSNVDGVIKFDDFYNLCVKMPPFLYPAFKLQHAMQKKFFGQKYWENKKIMHHEARILVKKLRDSGNDPNLVEPKFGDDNLQAGQARSARDRSKTQSGFKKKKPALTDAESLKKGFTDLRNKYFTVGEDKQESKEGKKGSDDAGGKLRRGEFHK